MIDKLPPYNLEAEAGVLGGCLLNNDVIPDVMMAVSVGDFYRDAHQVVFRAILQLHEAGLPVDAVTLSEELTRRAEYERVGGLEFLEKIINGTPEAVSAKYYAQIVHEKSTIRQLIEVADEIHEKGYSNRFTADELLARTQDRVMAIAADRSDVKAMTARDLVGDVLEQIKLRTHGKVSGIQTGLPDLDDVLGGLKPKTLTYLAGRTSMGKTALAIDIALFAALRQGKRVLIASLEMSKEEIIERMLVSLSGVDSHRVRNGVFSDRNWQDLIDAGEPPGLRLISILDESCMNLMQIGAAARREKITHGSLDLLLIDYIQLIEGEDNRESRREQIAKISRRSKALARQLDVHVLMLSQLNRGPENREGHRPRMSDLKETGDQEQDADAVLLLHRPEYFDPNDSPGQAIVIVAKNRSGRTADVPVVFLKQFMRFESLQAPESSMDRPYF